MASVGKEITSEKFEEYLVDFSEENKVNIDIPAVMRRLKSARSELEDDMEAYHSFYGDFKLYMENDINTIDSTGNINPTVLNVFTKNKKEEIRTKKHVKEVEESKLHNNKFEIEEKLSEEEINERLRQIDFTKITIDDFSFILENYDKIEDKLTVEEKKNVNNIVSSINILNTDKFLQTLQKFTLEIQEGKELSQEQIQELLDLEEKTPGLFEKYGLDRENINESFAKQRLNYDEISDLERTIVSLLMRYPEDGIIPKEYIINVVLENPTVKEGVEKYSNIINTDKLLNGELSKKDLLNQVQVIENTGQKIADVLNGSHIMNETFEASAISELEKNATRILDEDRLSTLETGTIMKNVFNDSIQTELGEDVTPISSFSSINLSSSFENIMFQFEQSTNEQQAEPEEILTQEEKNAQMQAENEQYIDKKMAVTRDYAEMGLEDSRTNLDAAEAFWGDEFGAEVVEDIGQEAVELENKTQQVKPIEPEVKVPEAFELDPIDQEEVPLEVQEEIDNSDYQQEIDEKTGIAGLFAAIANSRVGRAVKNLFKTKDAQKRLNAPVTQRTEDGLKITEYESNGSLMPTTIQARNFLRDFAVNTVEAVTNFANNIANTMRGNKEDEVINKPTIIKSEPVQEQAEKIEQQPVVEQIQEKTETFNDTNKWAVSNESRQRQAELNAAQAQKNSAQVGKIQDKTQEQNKDENEGIEY